MIPSKWPSRVVRDLVDSGALFVSDGFRAKRSQLGRHGVPFVRGGDIGDGWITTTVTDHVLPEFASQVAVKITQPGDVAFITKGTVGRAGRLRSGQPPVVFAPQVCYWRSLNLDEIDSTYLFYLVCSRWFQAQLDGVKTSGSMVADYVSISDQQHFELPLPPIDAQRRIGVILGALDDKIELNRKMNRTLDEMAQALFKSWFIDFDGHDDLVDSDLGPIPRGWEVRPISDVVEVMGGSTPRTKNPKFWDGGEIHWTTPKDLSSLSTPVLLDTARKITPAGLAKISSGLLPEGTLLLSSRAPVGYLAISQIPVAVNQGYIAMPPGGRASSLWLLYWAASNMDRIKARAGGTTFAEVSKRNFRPIPVVLPPPDELARFDETAGPLFERVVANERESRTLAALRDTLLPKLISGELRVPEAEAAVEAAT